MTTIIHELSTATPFATFWSINQKLASNKNGTMAGMITSRDPSPAYTAQTVKVFWWDDYVEDAIEVGTIVAATNPPSVVSASTGEFYVLIPDFISNTLRIWYWADIKNSLIKQEFIFSGLVIGGKWSAMFDEVRRRIVLIGQASGRLFYFDDVCTYMGNIQLLTSEDGPASLQYPAIQICDAGRVHVAYTTAENTPDGVSYRNIGYAWSPNNLNYTTRYIPKWDWSGNPWQSMPSLCGDNSPYGILRSEEYAANTLLTAFLVTENDLHFVYGYVNKTAGKYLAYEGKRAKQIYVSFNRLTGKYNTIHWPISVDGELPYFPGTFLCERGGNIYHVYCDKITIKIAKLVNGAWTKVYSVTLPAYTTGGTFIHYITGRLGKNSDDYIDFMCTIVNATYDQWVNGAADLAPSKVMYIKIPVDCL